GCRDTRACPRPWPDDAQSAGDADAGSADHAATAARGGGGGARVSAGDFTAAGPGSSRNETHRARVAEIPRSGSILAGSCTTHGAIRRGPELGAARQHASWARHADVRPRADGPHATTRIPRCERDAARSLPGPDRKG